ncbi:MAG: tetratricopeptide repeat protein, partial [Gemmatimonadetes bacterium]
RPATPPTEDRPPRAPPGGTLDPLAQDHFLRGRHLLRTAGDPAALTAAAAQFDTALALDPAFGRAHVALGEAFARRADLRAADRDALVDSALAHAETAVSVSPDLPEAYTLRALLRWTRRWDWSGAEADFQAALAAGDEPFVRRLYADYLASAARFDEALEQINRARDAAPGDPDLLAAHGALLFRASLLIEAEPLLRRAVELRPDNPEARIFLARTLLGLGRSREAADALGDARNPSADPLLRLWRAHILLREQRRPVTAERIMANLVEQIRGRAGQRADAPYWLASLHVVTGELDRAAERLAQAARIPSPALVWLPTDPLWAPLHGHPRYERLVERIRSGER